MGMYSNEKIKAMYDTGRLTKTNKAKVDRFLKSNDLNSDVSAIEGFGDWQCRFCAYAQHCHKPEIKADDVADDQMQGL